ncbi:MAG: hypothetical protein AAF126_17440, partial [Chloroflexota bacterium]
MTKQKRKAKPNQRRRIVFVLLVISFLSGALFYALQSDRQEEETAYQPDYLLYQDIVSVPDDNAPLMMYDPVEQTHRELFAQAPTGVGGYYGTPSGDVLVGQRGSLRWAGRVQDIFLFNIFDESPTLTDITNTPDTAERPIGWNDNWHYFAFTAKEDIDESVNQLLVYDGDNIFQVDSNAYNVECRNDTLYYITSEGALTHIKAWDNRGIRTIATYNTFTDVEDVQLLWADDDRFALTVWEVMPTYPNVPGVSAVYIWDGTTLQSVPNPSYFPQFTAHGWNRHNELILIARDEQYNNAVYVWDGETTL